MMRKNYFKKDFQLIIIIIIIIIIITIIIIIIIIINDRQFCFVRAKWKLGRTYALSKKKNDLQPCTTGSPQ